MSKQKCVIVVQIEYEVSLPEWITFADLDNNPEEEFAFNISYAISTASQNFEPFADLDLETQDSLVEDIKEAIIIHLENMQIEKEQGNRDN